MRRAHDATPCITGLGLVTGLGFGVAANREALRAGRTAIRRVDDGPAATSLAARVEEPLLRLEVPASLEAQLKFLNGSGLLAVEASSEACREAGWRVDDPEPERRGLWLSQMDGWDWSCLELRDGIAAATEEFTRPLEAEALNASCSRRVKPFFILDSLKNNAFSFLANLFDLQGANTATAGFDASTLALVDVAARALVRADLDRALVTGAGRITSDVARYDLSLHGLARPTDEPGYRPFDASGCGLVPGEASAALTLEPRGRCRSSLAALLGFGTATGAPLDGVLAPTAATVAAAVDLALEEAEVRPGDLAAAVLPAYGLPEADGALLAALASAPALAAVPAVCWRGAVGHTALASDVVDLVVAADGLRAGSLPGTVGLRTPLADAGRPIVGAQGVDVRHGGVLVVSAGLRGQASALVLGHVREVP
jgi:3-oxoacyl-(acyl-carrier-protein) synthase